jgi:hypothetical protein
MHRTRFTAAVCAAGVLAAAEALADPSVEVESRRPSTSLDPQVATAVASRLPLAFEVNRGQAPDGWDFLVRCRGYHAFVRSSGIVFSFDGAALAMSLERAEAVAPTTRGLELAGKVNYFLGNDPSKWLSDVPLTRGARYEQVAPGASWSVGGRGRALEFAFDVEPGFEAPRMVFEGAKPLRLDKDGALRLSMPHGEATISAPVAWQDGDGRRIDVKARWKLDQGGIARIETSPVARDRVVHVDPTVTYATYLGGSGQEHCSAAAMDAAGAVYSTGFTYSADYPTTSGAFSRTLSGGRDGYVAKIGASGSSLAYATYLGSSAGSDYFASIVVDAAGNACVAGLAYAGNYPTTSGVYSPSPPGGGTPYGVLTQLNSTGASLVFSTYTAARGGTSVAFGPSGGIYVLESVGLSLYSAGAAGLVFSKQLVPATETGNVSPYSMAADVNGFAYVVGRTNNVNAPAGTSGAYKTSPTGTDAFLTKIGSDGVIRYATFLGGTGGEAGNAVDVNLAGQAYVVGYTTSANFPTTSDALQSSLSSSQDGYVTRFNAAGSALRYSTYVGPGEPMCIRVHPGSSYVLGGYTTSSSFPVFNAFQASPGGARDGFLMKFDRANVRSWSSYCGGSLSETPLGLGMAPDGAVALVGPTSSSDFPTVSPLQSAKASADDDQFVVVVPAAEPTNVTVLGVVAVSPPTWTVGFAYDALQLTATGGVGPHVWSVSTGAPPMGMSVSAGGVLSGTPTQSGQFDFTTRADDPTEMFAERPVTLLINPLPSIATQALPAATSGAAFDRAVAVNGGSGTMSFSLVSGPTPPGLTLGADGRLHGMPTQTGDFSFTAGVQDGRGATASGTVSLHVNSPPSIHAATDAPTTETRPFAFQPTANDGTPAITWSVASGNAPVADPIDAATGRVEGTAKAAADYSFTLRATDSNGASGERAFVATVNPWPQIDASTLPRAAMGRPYDALPGVSGGTPPFTWQFASGAAPAGLTLNAASGRLTGTPTADGAARVELACTDSAGATVTRGFDVEVAKLADLTRRKSVESVTLAAGASPALLRSFEATAGSLIGVAVRGGGFAGVAPELHVYDAAGTEWDLLQWTRTRPKSVSVRGAPLPATGRWFLTVKAAAGFEGKLKLTITIAPPKSIASTGELSATPTEFAFSAPPGALVTVTAKAGKGSAALPRIVSVTGPDAVDLVPGGKTAEKGGKATFSSKTPRAGGDWKVVFATRDGTAGDVAWTVKLKLPKTYDFALPDLPAGE